MIPVLATEGPPRSVDRLRALSWMDQVYGPDSMTRSMLRVIAGVILTSLLSGCLGADHRDRRG